MPFKKVFYNKFLNGLTLLTYNSDDNRSSLLLFDVHSVFKIFSFKLRLIIFLVFTLKSFQMVLILISLKNTRKSFRMLITDQKNVSLMLSFFEQFQLCPLKKYSTINFSIGSRYSLMIVTRLDLKVATKPTQPYKKKIKLRPYKKKKRTKPYKKIF